MSTTVPWGFSRPFGFVAWRERCVALVIVGVGFAAGLRRFVACVVGVVIVGGERLAVAVIAVRPS